ncbi:hypothetical protein [Algicella marina]|uniref:Lipoprotein n=1 Tax=Algicella marina TaxID=2683284 RepID=A0A6P1T1Y6_9RHOB|nr:hypothetical protein [Algicella marina]QHQ36748.1 hypothetical protein GO499_16985 [Algicella marina]
MRRLSLLALPLLALPGCETTPAASAADEAVEYLYSDTVFTEQERVEVRARMANPTRRLTLERYAACQAADAAKSRGFIWGKRLRGSRRIDGNTEDLLVLYTFSRFQEFTGEGTFTAALFTAVCEAEGIPIGPRDERPEEPLPDLTLEGRGAPVEGPSARGPDVILGPGLEEEPEPIPGPDPIPIPPPADSPPTDDPEFGI